MLWELVSKRLLLLSGTPAMSFSSWKTALLQLKEMMHKMLLVLPKAMHKMLLILSKKKKQKCLYPPTTKKQNLQSNSRKMHRKLIQLQWLVLPSLMKIPKRKTI